MSNSEKQYRSEAFAAIHETMEGLHKVGAITKTTMRRFDETCLTPVRQFSGDEIRALRERENVSQSVFACYLNVSKKLILDWERDVKKTGGAALRLLEFVDKHGLQFLE